MSDHLPKDHLPMLTLPANWMNLIERLPLFQQKDRQCHVALKATELGCVPEVTALIWHFCDPQYHEKWLIWNSLSRYWLYEYLILSKDCKGYPIGLFKEMQTPQIRDLDKPMFTTGILLCLRYVYIRYIYIYDHIIFGYVFLY